MDTAEHTALHRLAAYGTLGPGGPNDHQLDGLQGRWLEGYVNGRLVAEGWGASLGFPALILSSGARLSLFTSSSRSTSRHIGRA
jgi:gamma-glutamylcyclotransferase (GGCT)/AIG2-like uncharacterized protein YtfP